ncbi:kinase, partial [Streptomyces sp. SID7982]|nr:kinase [Streptomyces sp. SID7982]
DGREAVIGPDSVLDRTVDRIMLDTGLAGLPPVDR